MNSKMQSRNKKIYPDLTPEMCFIVLEWWLLSTCFLLLDNVENEIALYQICTKMLGEHYGFLWTSTYTLLFKNRLNTAMSLRVSTITRPTCVVKEVKLPSLLSVIKSTCSDMKNTVS